MRILVLNVFLGFGILFCLSCFSLILRKKEDEWEQDSFLLAISQHWLKRNQLLILSFAYIGILATPFFLVDKENTFFGNSFPTFSLLVSGFLLFFQFLQKKGRKLSVFVSLSLLAWSLVFAQLFDFLGWKWILAFWLAWVFFFAIFYFALRFFVQIFFDYELSRPILGGLVLVWTFLCWSSSFWKDPLQEVLPLLRFPFWFLWVGVVLGLQTKNLQDAWKERKFFTSFAFPIKLSFWLPSFFLLSFFSWKVGTESQQVMSPLLFLIWLFVQINLFACSSQLLELFQSHLQNPNRVWLFVKPWVFCFSLVYSFGILGLSLLH